MDADAGLSRRHRYAFRDAFSNASSAALFVLTTVMFAAGALAGVSVIAKLGTIGWFIYGFVMVTYALVFGPVIASAVTLRQRGSAKHRAEIIARRDQQLRKFGLHGKFDPAQFEDPRQRRFRRRR